MDSGHLGLNHIKVGNVWQILFNWSHVPAMSSFFRTLYTYKIQLEGSATIKGFCYLMCIQCDKSPLLLRGFKKV